MFKAELNDPNILKTSFDAISSIVDEVQIQVDSEGMRLDALDRSHITFVHLELHKELFDEYECPEPEKINVDTEELMKVLRRARAGDRLIITSDDTNLILTFEGEATRQFKIRLIDIEYETPQPPEIGYENEFEVPFSLLKDAIADIDIFSDKITFKVDEEKFIVSSTGEFGDAMIEYYHGEKIKEPARSVYSLDKIKEMLKADRFSETAIINLGNDMPLKLTLKMPNDEGELSFLLAPRLEAEE
ncbi:proliferating cell nuclear antigen (pcna) [Methanothermobacter tenebrarum]|uniref:DNA polymerase sliding clamp n=1 Tax=Methanothermobacter tenebrarum TaxID=680118 RepID=A0A328PE41_9EURY|nr:proliferating cell nuclear antigen (pcna) [Methanothermobacter tenebrarum]MBC7100626.1 proliferating cell nuclear antigen (pcna) [Methanobacteriales archaeon]MBC7118119.1 proliferating cell nuclear antigen (pcna) [Methanobacteriaceae archaeon]NPV65309.1 proliferating cell nuclear antigen (pcna) [Methanobacteriaceae archaeon]RAO79663.1 proliferating cell nuclear antigen (pcna) [Methanothermobacter tenebrarum]